ncbi:hypothetical protein NEMIN01_0260 [Nematocida minor]|uniref:uncharacterized protein n=1 Tax=Nematocida minor TaxID=1912983 RepID=UPI00221F6C06|nr:uncharacterized protein NEMIN01_0260 [Nematocida minor]KAI5189094.1 hypothetical protein NEMIN01_0260 [Nematocida minor]
MESLSNEEMDVLLGIGESIDSIISRGSMGKYSSGVVRGYFPSDESCDVLSSKSVRRSLMKIQETDKDAFCALFKAKDPMAW